MLLREAALVRKVTGTEMGRVGFVDTQREEG